MLEELQEKGMTDTNVKILRTLTGCKISEFFLLILCILRERPGKRLRMLTKVLLVTKSTLV